LPAGTTVQICGAGPIGRGWVRGLRRLGYHVHRFVDVDPKKHGRIIDGVAVVSPQDFDPADGFVLAAVGVPGARAQIETFLQTRGLRSWHDYLAVA
jgi:S-adenosylhomocysteine hydrolase